MENETRTSYEQLININRKLASDIDDNMRRIDLAKVVIVAETSVRTYDNGDFSVTARVANYGDFGSNSVDVSCFNHDDFETNKSKASFFLNQMESFFAYVKKNSKNSNEQ